MEQMQLPLLNETEEAVFHLMKRISELEHENTNLRNEIRTLNWTLQEHD
jgi:prefoldin subunit 5